MAVEFALVIGLVVFIFFGATELGRALYQYNALVKAARAAAREYSLAGPVGTIGSREQQAQCIAVYAISPCAKARKEDQVMDGLTMDKVAMTSGSSYLIGSEYPYTYGCATISEFHFVSLVPWFDMTFAPIAVCMRQNPS